MSEWANETLRKECFLQFILKDKSEHQLAQNIHFFVPTKDLTLPQTDIDCKVKTLEGRCEVILTSSRLAKDVFIQIPIQGAHFSDNFFDLLPNESRKIIITSPEIHKGEKPEITMKHIRETY